jgi:hypothetical protein
MDLAHSVVRFGRSAASGRMASCGQWRTFPTRERMAEQLATVIAGLKQFLLPLIEDVDGDWRWNPREGWAR